MSALTPQQVLAERRKEFEETGEISASSRLLDAIFGFEISRNGYLTYERWEREHGVLFRVLVGRVWA